MQHDNLPVQDLKEEIPDNNTVGYAIYNNEVITFADAAFCQIIGVSPGEILLQPVGRFFDIEMNSGPTENRRVCLKGDPGTIPVFLSRYPLNGPAGECQIIKIIRAGNRNETFQSRIILRQLLSALPDLLLTLDKYGRITGYYETANPNLAIDRSQMYGFDAFSLASPADREPIRQALKQCLEQNEPASAHYTITTNTETLHFEARFVAFRHDEALCVIRDITASFLAEENSRTIRRILELLVQITGRFISTPHHLTEAALTDAISLIGVEMGAEAVLLYQFDDSFTVSRKAEWVTSLHLPNPDKQQAIPSAAFDEWAPAFSAGEIISVTTTAPFHSAHPARTVSEPYGLHAMEIVPLSDGKQCSGFIVFEYSRLPAANRQHTHQLMHLFADLTGTFINRQQQEEDLGIHRDRLARQNEELTKLNTLYQSQNKDIAKAHQKMREAKEMAEASDRLKSAFLNMVTHEIRTPLNGILGFAQLMSVSDTSEAEMSEYLNILQTSTDRLLNTVNNMLHVSLIMSGNTTPNHETFDLNEFFRSLQKYTFQQLEYKSIAIHLTLPDESLTVNINTDANLLRQAFEQLAGNAVKYTRQGFIELGFSYDDSHIRMWVKDTGIGIAENAQKRVFKAFNQEDEHLTRKFEGLGLGLSVANGLIEVLGGHIEMISKKNSGSTFTAVFPLAALSPDFIRPKLNHPKVVPAVIIGDADAGSYATLRLFLNNNGIETVVATTAGELLDHCSRYAPHALVLVSTKLPGMATGELARRIRKLSDDIRLFAIDSNDAHRLHTEASNYPFHGYLTKPVSWVYVKSIIERYSTHEH